MRVKFIYSTSLEELETLVNRHTGYCAKSFIQIHDISVSMVQLKNGDVAFIATVKEERKSYD